MINQFKTKLKKNTALNKIIKYIKQCRLQLLVLPILFIANYFDIEISFILFILSGVWSSGGNLANARRNLAGCGTQTAGLSFGGYFPTSLVTEEYNGTAWSSGGNLAVAKQGLAGCGTQTTGLSFGGRGVSNYATTEEYNGTSWSSGGGLAGYRFNLAGCGTQTAGLSFGGYDSGAVYTTTEEYNGTAWSSGGDMATGREWLAGCGTQTAGLNFGGGGPSAVTEEYNGTAWSSGGTLATAENSPAGAGAQTAGLCFGGQKPVFTYSNLTEEYDGTSWSSGGNLATARYRLAGGGTQSIGLSFGGNNGSDSAVTEEYNIFALSDTSIQTKSNLQSTITKNIQSKASIKAILSTSIQVKANIKTVISKTIQAKASIKHLGVSQSIQSKASIAFERTKTIQAKANLKITQGRNVLSKATIKLIQTRTLTTKASIKHLNITQTISAKANIEGVVTIRAKARIQVTNITSITTKGRVQVAGIAKTITAKATIQLLQTRTISGKAKIITESKTRHKLSYKLYQPDGTYIKTLDQEDIISEFQINKTINGGVSALKVVLNKPIDNYDEYDAVKNSDGSIKYGNRLKVFLNDANNTDKQIFYGYLVSIGPNYSNGKESVELIFYGATAKLKNDYFRDLTPPSPETPSDFYIVYVSGATGEERLPANASEIIKDIVDNYDDGVSNGMLSYVWGTTIDDCGGTDVEYTFDRVKHYDGVKKIQEFLPATWYWYVNGEGKVYVKNSAVATSHKLIIGRHITTIKSHKTSEDIINYFILWNSRSTADLSYVYVNKEDATSRANYGTQTLFQVDSAILSDAVATIRKDKVIEYSKDPKEEITIEITDKYDIASIEPGHRVSIRNLRADLQTTFADDLVVKKISYRVDSALLELGALGSDLTKFAGEENSAFEEALNQVQTFTSDLQSGNLALTEANIQYEGVSFINKNNISSPNIIGTNGYFKDLIRIGTATEGSIIRTYDKLAFNDTPATQGIWIEKTDGGDINFELYKDASNFLRFDSGASPALTIRGGLNADDITAGTLTVGYTEADVTADNAQAYSWLTGSKPPVNADNTQDKLDLGASILYAKVSGSTLIQNGYVRTNFLTADNIVTGTLTAAVSGGVAEIIIKGRGYLTFKNTAGTSKGEVYTDTSNFYLASLASGVKTWIIGHNGVTISTVGNAFIINLSSTEVSLNTTNYSGFIGTSSNHLASIYAQTYYFGKSGYTTKYIQRGASGIEMNTNLYVDGALSKNSGTFKIDHPLKPKTHWLEHSFVESPDMLNLYTGNAIIKRGKCKIKMPNWFIPLNGKNKKDYSYQLTSIGQENSLWVEKEMTDKGEVVFAGRKNGKFSYVVTGIRHDKWAMKHRVQVETKKDTN